MYKKNVLINNVNLNTIYNNCHSSALIFTIGAGTRDELVDELGAAHLVEHLIANNINSAFKTNFGVWVNGFTTRDHIVILVNCFKRNSINVINYVKNILVSWSNGILSFDNEIMDIEIQRIEREYTRILDSNDILRRENVINRISKDCGIECKQQYVTNLNGSYSIDSYVKRHAFVKKNIYFAGNIKDKVLLNIFNDNKIISLAGKITKYMPSLDDMHLKIPYECGITAGIPLSINTIMDYTLCELFTCILRRAEVEGSEIKVKDVKLKIITSKAFIIIEFESALKQVDSVKKTLDDVTSYISAVLDQTKDSKFLDENKNTFGLAFSQQLDSSHFQVMLVYKLSLIPILDFHMNDFFFCLECIDSNCINKFCNNILSDKNHFIIA